MMFALLIVPLFYIFLFFPALARNSRHDQRLTQRQLQADIERREALEFRNTSMKPATASSEPLTKRDGTKYVFMHHIVGNTYPYVYNDWLNDVKQISAMGVDAVALNIGSDVWQWDRVVDAYNAAAASGTGLKMFISFDYTSFVCDNGYATTNWTNYFAKYSAQFTVNSKPMISTYGGGYDCLGVDNWKAVKANTNGYLMPFFWDSENTFKTDWAFLDSWYCWGCAWPQGDWDKNTTDDQYYIQQLGAGRYATTVSGWFFTHLSSKNFYLRGDDWLLINRWDELFQLRDQLTFVEMVTWNDYGESDYFGPFEGAQPAGTYWAQNYPHTAWISLSQYYITAYKTGAYPTITQDVVYWWSRPHPALATATGDSLGRPTGYNWSDDYLWAAAFCTSTCTVTLTLGGSTQTFSNLPYGVNKLKLPLAVGTVGIKMVKGSTTVINASPTGFSVVATPSQYNYNVFVGAETASIAVIGTSSTSTSTMTSTSASVTATSTSTSFTSVGCVAEGTTGTRRALTSANYTDSAMTPAKCQSFCASYTYAGTEYSTQCYCGNTITNNGATGAVVASSNCNSKCGGDSSQSCGGSYYLNLYSKSVSSSSSTKATSTSTSTSSSASSTSSSFSSVGCIAEGTTGTRRALTGANYTDSAMTPAKCQSFCASYTYAGTEYSTQCYCGNSLTNNGATGTIVASSNCNDKCGGDSSQTCGGSYYLNLYSKSGVTSSSSTTSSTSTTTTTKTTSSTTSTSASASSTSSSTSFSYVGCVAEGTTGTRRALTGASYTDSAMTPAKCETLCAGYTYAGTEYSTQCYCGNTITNNGATGSVVASSNCNYKCAGDSSQACGGSYYLSLYSKASSNSPITTSTSSTATSASTASAASSTSTSTSFSAVGCVAEGTTGSRYALTGANYRDSAMTTEKCQSLCAGYTYAGTEYSSECFCGNTVTNNGATGSVVDSSNCNYKCAGNSAESCGGSWYLNLYKQ
ncbi:glycosyl hydrolase family 71-domain-containing protein [Lentinula boryana]|uniref:Glycosyl hydrolase family 71-domain-containing protein n=1 Tax=Lentinula boryana TaxID=40481 RepID=A0ABQ8Q7T2_9AGAR|nr:glycosyl hydrolase family 71-domain-containing protein [Lentinula boryana]